ncbi:MAG: TauD/TfdA dioxygenase family protein [Acidimicrobiales bacterium]
MTSDMQVRRLAGSLGAAVTGIDLTDLGPENVATIESAIIEYGIVAFPGQQLDDDQHRRLTEALGGVRPPVEYLPTNADAGHPDIAVLDSRGGIRADIWHTDVSWSPTPPSLSILRSLIVPTAGGDTMWANQYAAYDVLSEAMKDFLSGLTAFHSGQKLPLEGGTIQGGREGWDATHPVIRTHPVTGRRALYVNETFTRRINELESAESDALLSFLFGQATRTELTCRWSWGIGDLVIWDNRCVQHYGVYDYEEHRLMHRTEVVGDAPV